jgi:hypothetical protein
MEWHTLSSIHSAEDFVTGLRCVATFRPAAVCDNHICVAQAISRSNGFRTVARQLVQPKDCAIGCLAPLAALASIHAVGFMNVIWMAPLRFTMAGGEDRAADAVSKAIGAVFMAIGMGYIAASVAAPRPLRAG